MFSFKNFVPVTVKNRVRVRVRVRNLELGFRARVRIRNLIGGAGGAHILMTSYACTSDVIRIFYFGRKSAVFVIPFL